MRRIGIAQQPFHILARHVLLQLPAERGQALQHGLLHCCGRIAGLDRFVNPVFHEQAHERLVVHLFGQPAALALQFPSQNAHQPRCVVAQDRGNIHFDRLVVRG